jgi:RNA polymerase sigma factor (sigma-70 family)
MPRRSGSRDFNHGLLDAFFCHAGAVGDHYLGAMTTELQLEAPTDTELVALSISGDRQAYRGIVERYQSLICGLTFAACGDLHRSEDLAQETFLEGWKHLSDLKDSARLRSWLCGIARNLISSDRRQRYRAPVIESQLSDQTASDAISPPQEAITREEQALIWSALEQLPIEYREPMVLYYRQQESVAEMAAALELSEDAARQRLVRGRAMLAGRLDALIDRGLRAGAPTRAFTLAVVAAIPGAAVSAKASTLGAAIKGSASGKAAASTGFLSSSLLGPIVGILGAYVGYRSSMNQAIAPQERSFMRRFAVRIVLLVLAFNALLLPFVFWSRRLHLSAVAAASLLIAAILIYSIGVVFLIIRFNVGFRKLRAQLVSSDSKMADDARKNAAQFAFEYRSPLSLFGLPLLHVNLGYKSDGRPRAATGWIAVGGRAIAPLFACGAIAIAPISFGGIAIGLVTFGGLGAGLLTFGGLAIGIWSVGGLAIGWNAVGGAAIAWCASEGGVAIARSVAQGGLALAPHANDAIARAFCASNRFFRFCDSVLPYANWLWLLWLPMIIPLLRRQRQDHDIQSNHAEA